MLEPRWAWRPRPGLVWVPPLGAVWAQRLELALVQAPPTARTPPGAWRPLRSSPRAARRVGSTEWVGSDRQPCAPPAEESGPQQHTQHDEIDQLCTSSVRIRANVCVYCRVVLAAERRRLVLQAMGSRHAVSVAELAARLRVSTMTIRRDLESLASQGVLTRVHGGAVPTATTMPTSNSTASFVDNAVHRQPEKDRIGAAAAQLVNDGETILLDVGTTTLQLARHLRDRALTVITNNLGAYEELLGAERIELLLLGGLVDRHYRSLGGFLAEEALRQVRADRAFLSASAIRGSDLAVLDDTAVDLRLKRGMIAAASQVILLADAEKFGQLRPVRVCGPDELDVLITDNAAPEGALDEFEAAGVRVLRV